MNKLKYLRMVAVLVLITFSWFTFFTHLSWGQEKETLEQKIQRFIQEGDYEGAIDMLKSYIDKIKDLKEKNKSLALAYYHLARTSYRIGVRDDIIRQNLKSAYQAYPNLKIEQEDRNLYFKEIALKVKEEVLKEKAAQDKIKAKQVEEQKDKKVEDVKTKEEIKREEKKESAKSGVVLKQVKKKKKKFPWLLAVGVVVVAVVAIIFLSKGNENDSDRDIDPNFDMDVLGIKWVEISEGEFEMGDNFNEGEAWEKPVHKIFLDKYAISKCEITFNQYDRFCEDINCEKPHDEGWGRDNRPVINISWHNARDFCNWLSKKTGKNITLPTEAQWEKAARNADQRRYPWGNLSPNANRCNFNNNLGRTTNVLRYPLGKSPYGVFDMAGNVWEWCSDWYGENYYSHSPKDNPQGPNSGGERVIRGGGLDSNGYIVRSAFRHGILPEHTNTNLGFRIVWQK